MCLSLVQFANGWFSLWFLGASIHACKLSGQHLVALEGDPDIFEAIIAPLCEANPLMTCGSVPKTTSSLMRMHMFGRWQNDHASVRKF